MAIEVMRKGTPPTEMFYVVDCVNCQSRLRFFRRDGRIMNDARTGSYLSVTCPVCDKEVTVAV